MRSKEDMVLDLFYNRPKQWRFEELLEAAGISRPQLARWLRRFEAEGMVERVKERRKHPFYRYNYEDPRFRNRKRLYGLQLLTESGLLDHLAALEGAKAVVLFGSFSRADWYAESDVDIFIYGDDAAFELGKFERILGREIQIFTAKDRKSLGELGEGLMKNILCGLMIKGPIPPEMFDAASPEAAGSV